jgi:hypothetical protein
MAERRMVYACRMDEVTREEILENSLRKTCPESFWLGVAAVLLACLMLGGLIGYSR